VSRFNLAAALFVALLCGSAQSWSSTAAAQDAVYEGPWNTTNRKLDGIMTCEVTQLAKEKWKGRFYGVWQGVPFDYTVTFTGPPDDLRGTATIDHADYDWTGKMEPANIAQGQPGRFKATFGGTRYAGYFDMKAKIPKTVRTASRPVEGEVR
jgi:hypothetical protein